MPPAVERFDAALSAIKAITYAIEVCDSLQLQKVACHLQLGLDHLIATTESGLNAPTKTPIDFQSVALVEFELMPDQEGERWLRTENYRNDSESA